MTEAFQLIDENKQFNTGLKPYLQSVGADVDRSSYHVVSVFGSQSTGKSTLLNALFQTNFSVMSEESRAQTTKGIWLGCCSKHADANGKILVLDVEGTDGRERGEDQDFERKAALFALASSEVLIINMWENQVGLYHGANMSLLKTVFEVNLSLFQSSGSTHRSRILFVIRDYLDKTPLANLAQTLRTDLNGQWEAISKPSPELKDCKIDDFFDISFAALPHGLLKPEEFKKEVNTLSESFTNPQVDNYMFDPLYHFQIPLDGWSLYAEQIWQQIELNKDLDLPTQQILVARFRCDDIASETWENFSSRLGKYEASGQLKRGFIMADFGVVMRQLRSDAVTFFDANAGRYQASVYKEKRFELLGKLDSALSAHYHDQLIALHVAGINCFNNEMQSGENKKINFVTRIQNAYQKAAQFFEEKAADATIDPSFYSFAAEKETFLLALDKLAKEAKDAEMSRFISKISKQINKKLEHKLRKIFKRPEKDAWLRVEKALSNSVEEVLNMSAKDDCSILGETAEEKEHAHMLIVAASWRALNNKIADLVKPDNLQLLLREIFETSFKFDETGTPIVWSESDDINAAYVKARDLALEVLPLLSSAQLPDGKLLRPMISLEDFDSDPEDLLDYTMLITEEDRDGVREAFKRLADMMYLETKRSVSQRATRIPPIIYLLLIALGWNEFLAVIRNPFLVVLILLVGAGLYTIYTLNLAGPVIRVIERTVDGIVREGKMRLREYLEITPIDVVNSGPHINNEKDEFVQNDSDKNTN